MYKSKEFDYDLWTTTENGTKHYWARVKATGEVTEVSHEVMKFLRAEEKRVYREITAIKNHGSPLSLDAPHDEEKESWYEDHRAGVSEMETILFEEEFRKTLTPNQILVFDECLLGNMSETVFAVKHSISIPVACKRIAAVRKKAKKFFGVG
ncbi:MAG: hypothetical protein ACOYJR_01050 [Acutalibacteraceae bacterium]